MIEIEFRGKVKENFCDDKNQVIIPKGKWIYGGVTYNDTRVWIDTPYLGEIIVDRETVGQYTGYKDKKGEKIFNGDILTLDKTLFSDKTKYVLLWNKKYLRYYLFPVDKKKKIVPGIVLEAVLSEMMAEITGNIYDEEITI